MKSATGREQGRELQLGTKPPACPGPRRGLAQIYLESLGHRVRRQWPGGGCREAQSASLPRELRSGQVHGGAGARSRETDVGREGLVPFEEGQ